MKLDFPRRSVALLLGLAVLITSQSACSADEPASNGPGRHGRGHDGQGGGPGGGMGRGRGRGPGGPMRDDPEFVKDRTLFHQLLDNHESIERTVKNTDAGILTVTESDDPEVSKWIQEHVASMKNRVEEVRPIHMRDPLFRAVFSNAKKIEMKVEKTKKGVRVTETSKDPFVTRLIQAHARVVSLFLENGHVEVHRDHAVPEKNDDEPGNEQLPTAIKKKQEA